MRRDGAMRRGPVRKARRILLTAVCGMVCLPAAGLAGESANVWRARCLATATTSERLQCLSYILGLADGYASWAPQDSRPICFPTEATNGQLQEVALKYLEDHPEERHLPFDWMVFKSFAQAFPCGAATPPDQPRP